MMFETDRKLPTGTDVKIDIHTPKGGNAVHCAGRVIWSTQTSDSLKYYNGIEFTNIEEDNKNTFLRFLCDAIYKSGINR
jgi:hypothetical protein